jgi:colanic acid/amylovoran biosynthesis glycosyltransferase
LRTLNVARFGRRALLLQVACQIIPFLRRADYDIIHSQFGNLSEVGLLLRETGLFQGKLVTSFRGYDISSYVEANGPAVYKQLFRNGDLFLCVSENIRGKLLGLGCPGSKAVVHRSGIDLKPIQPGLRAGSSEKVRLLTVARLTEKKGVEYGIRAVAKLANRYPQLEYLIAGDGPLGHKLRSLIEELKVGATIKLIGWKSQDEIAQLLDESDMLIAPSVTTEIGEQEGIPGVIMEAFAHQVPVLSTLHAGIGEVVEDGQSGFLVPEADYDALAERLELLLLQPDWRQRMGLKGREFVEKHYDIDKLNDRLVTIYRSLLETNTWREADSSEAAFAPPLLRAQQ